MKKITLFLLACVSFSLVSCFDTVEEVEIKADGSGTLAMKTDMSKIMEIMKNFAGEDVKKEGMDRPIDTVMFMKNYIDTASSVPADQKQLFRDGKVHLKMDMDKSVLKMDMNFPFTSPAQLQQLYSNLNTATGGLQGVFGNLGPKKIEQKSDEPSLGQISSVYDITVKDGAYSRKVNKARYDEFMKTVKLEELKQMSGMLGEMKYTTSVKLPRAVRSVSNSKAVLSADKKVVRLNVNLMEVFDQPNLLELDISY